jgi:hypothetical protein
MHANSLSAYDASAAVLSRRSREIHALLLVRGPMTDREVMLALGFTDMNAVRPRITELTKDHWAHECGETEDPVTGKTVRKTAAYTEEQRLRILENKLEQQPLGI